MRRCIIFDDADLDMAIETAMVAKFRNSGQSCIAANRIYVQAGIHDALRRARSPSGSRRWCWATGFDEATDIGPLIDDAAVDKVNEHLDEARRAAAATLLGGRARAGPA